jgi:uncharacterized protein (DUF302 family)
MNAMRAAVKPSRYSYADTVSTLSKALTDAGNTIFTIIDQAGAAAAAGLTLRPTSLIVFGNPKGGTHLMDAFPLVALDLPLKLLVWEHRDGVMVAYVPMSEISTRYGLTGVDAQITAMDRALDTLTDLVKLNARS